MYDTAGYTWFNGIVLLLTIIPVNNVADGAENGAFFASATAYSRGCGDDSNGKPAERQRLEPHAPGPSQRGKEKSFTAEQRRLDLSDVLNVVI